MLISVVENGQAQAAQVEGYQIAGKTGTAQVASSQGGYSKSETIHNFIGYGPANNPAFLMLVKIDRPTKVAWSSISAAPTFAKMAKFILNYYQIQPQE
jgi:cell division protein FtsI/penicillin-binding protein 2